MNKSILVRVFGFPATLIHGDTLVVDRWRWLKERIPETSSKPQLVDIGCGSGAFSIGASLRGYSALGLSWDDRNQRVATERAGLCGALTARFDVLDVRKLDSRRDLVGKFDVAICCENIEHIIDDHKLVRDIAACLRPGGRMLLTTPYLNYRPMSREDEGPFLPIEDGRHVRRGYTGEMLQELCAQSGLIAEQVSYCSGMISQKLTSLLRVMSKLSPFAAWAFVLPMRPLPLLLDGWLTRALGWPFYSICLEARKPDVAPPA